MDLTQTMPERAATKADTTRFMYTSQCSESRSSSAASNLSFAEGLPSAESRDADETKAMDEIPMRPVIVSDSSPEEVFQPSVPSSTPEVSDVGLQGLVESAMSSVVSVDLRVEGEVPALPVPPLMAEKPTVKYDGVDDEENQSFQMRPNPIEDAEELIDQIPLLSDELELKRLTRPDRVRHIFILGATGRIGQQVLRFLSKKHFDHSPTFHCLVRANGLEAARTRLLSALETVFGNKTEAAAAFSKCRVWVGDMTEPRFGLEEADYWKLCGRIESIYMAAGPDWHDLLTQYNGISAGKSGKSLYGLASPTAVRHWSMLFEMAAAQRMKHIFAFVPLFYSMEMFVDTAASSSSVTTISESQVYDRFALNKLGVSPHSNLFGCIAWCKGVVEAVLRHARQVLDYSVTVFRIPPFGFCAQTEMPNKIELKRKSLLSWNILRAVVREGQIPMLADHIFGVFAQPVDEALKAAVDLSMAPKRVHWVYHMVDDVQMDSFSKDNLINVLNQLGIFLENVSWETWYRTVEARGKDSCLAGCIAALDNIVKNTSINSSRSIAISNSQLRQDLSMIGQTPCWTQFDVFGKDQIRHLLHSHFFPPDSLGTLKSIEECMAEAIKIAGGLDNFGPHIDLFIDGWKRFLASIREPSNPPPSFWGMASITRTIIVHFLTHLYMTERERVCPKILQEEIKAPIFVVGLNRAGTTFVHSMLAQDTANHRCPVLLEMLFPYGEKGDYQPVGIEANDKATWEQDPRRNAATDLITLQMGSDLKKYMAALHDRLSLSYEEDFVAFEGVGRSYSMAAGFQADSFVEWLFANDGEVLRQCYPYHRRLFQHLQYQRPGKRWIFKMPWHLWTIETLFETYPDAELIFIHRRPSSAVQSWCGLEKLLHSNFLLSADLIKIGERGLKTMGLLIDKALAYQENMAMKFVQEHPDLQPPHSFFYNLYFDSVVESPIVSIREIYERLDLGPFTMAAESAMWNFMEEARRHRASVMKVYPHCELADVGLTKRDVKARFQIYYDMYFDSAQRERRLQEFKTARAIRRNEVQREKHYDENGMMLIEGPSILERAGFDYARRNMETMLSYAKTKLFTPLHSD
eukprot:Gregarina_sp_Poly_1__10435@NODE_754_length_6432_cov_237_128358_g558_i0_p1_GENE_NODE_754_length_6432_cov_237_128358_g558_i0NODE_754_length_6432_cov_237_128358_g558_i0_p1_ORF_typecomplete_len1089_score152_83Sulfotransfer_3/PF13469_6/2_1e22NAD_binding_4/PF07993_12/4_7e15Sulfotransfer_1/PF00685_27/0_0017NmrA/PF05368_13/5_4e03NmrA/PF05368_13/0_031Semialdhyde_dh/PF01118_24/0_033Sulfotransfer_4/PF17784_1/1DapB_N/PF01113_20/0_2Augurin/PF15187_6/0_25_NODE_754_length_6432_cov_237_128358_g558_i017154981